MTIQGVFKTTVCILEYLKMLLIMNTEFVVSSMKEMDGLLGGDNICSIIGKLVYFSSAGEIIFKMWSSTYR